MTSRQRPLRGTVIQLASAVVAAVLVITGLSSLTDARAAIVPATYTISATPTNVPTHAAKTFAVKITNSSPGSSDLLKTGRVTLPSGFTSVHGVSTVPSGWGISTSGRTVTIHKSLGMLPGGSVTVSITATTPSAAGTYTWSSSASGLVNGLVGSPFVRSGPEPTTRVDQFVGFCPAHEDCTSPTLFRNNTTAQVTTHAGDNNDRYTLSLSSPKGDKCGEPVAGDQATFTNRDLTRFLTVTMSIDTSVLDEATYEMCFDAKNPFTDRNGAPATLGSDGFYHGYLPDCVPTESGYEQVPCLIDIYTDCPFESCSLVAVFASPPGDPRGMFGIFQSA